MEAFLKKRFHDHVVSNGLDVIRFLKEKTGYVSTVIGDCDEVMRSQLRQ